jgi:hypothetical protein
VNQRNVDVRVWIVTQDNGTNAATTQARVDAHIADANLIWQQCGIQFNLVSTTSLQNTAALTPSEVGRDVLSSYDSTHINTGGIEIVYVNSFPAPDDDVYGEATDAGIVMNDNATSRTAAHELGHAMGLGEVGGTVDLHVMAQGLSTLKADITLAQCNGLTRFTSD